jgi:p-aminobenzoyl-glutamate transporter AbgT
VVFASRYDKRSGIGTVIALTLPFFIAMTIVWTLFFFVWYLLASPGVSALEAAAVRAWVTPTARE